MHWTEWSEMGKQNIQTKIKKDSKTHLGFIS